MSDNNKESQEYPSDDSVSVSITLRSNDIALLKKLAEKENTDLSGVLEKVIRFYRWRK